MGLWDWIFDALVGGDSGSNPKDARTPPDEHAPRESAVATVEESKPAPPDNDGAEEPRWWESEGYCPREVISVKRPDMSAEARALRNTLRRQLDGHNLTMPPMPAVPQRVLNQLGRRNYDLSRIADIIAEDQVVAAALLRTVNSPWYRGVHEISSLQLAAARMGIKALRTLMMNQALRAVTFQKKKAGRRLAEAVWRRSVASACIASGLAGFTDVTDDQAWILGLLHDVGNVIVLREIVGERTNSPEAIDGDAFEYLCYESHQEFGELVANAWNLPPALKAVVSEHHTYPTTDDPLRTERLLVQLTDMIAALLGFAPHVSYNLLESRAARDLGLSERDDFIAFLERLPGQLEDAMIYF